MSHVFANLDKDTIRILTNYKITLKNMLEDCVDIKNYHLYLKCQNNPQLDWKTNTKSLSKNCDNLKLLNIFRFRYACYLLFALAALNGINENDKYSTPISLLVSDPSYINIGKLRYNINYIGNIDGSTTLQSDIDVTISSTSGFSMIYVKLHKDFFAFYDIDANLNDLDKWFDMNVYFVNFDDSLQNVCNETTLAWSKLRLIQYYYKNEYIINNKSCINDDFISLIKSSITTSINSLKLYTYNQYLSNYQLDFNKYLSQFYQNTELYEQIVNVLLSKEYDSDIQKLYDLSLATFTSKDQFYTFGSYKHIVNKQKDLNPYEFIQSAFENLGFLCEYLESKDEKDYCHDEDVINLKCAKYLERIITALGLFYNIKDDLYIHYNDTIHTYIDIIIATNKHRQSGQPSPKKLNLRYMELLFGNDKLICQSKLTYLKTNFINKLLEAFPICTNICEYEGGSGRYRKRRILTLTLAKR